MLAHPDDESLGVGGTLARYAAEGAGTYLVTATRGERGRFFDNERRSPPGEVGRVREAELRAACEVLGVREVHLLDYPDGALDKANAAQAAERIAAHIRRVKPQVVVTFGPDGAYGHPDHIAVSQFTAGAIVRAADVHAVSKFYFMAWRKAKWDAYQAALKTLTSTVDGVERRAASWPDWAVTSVIDTTAWWPRVWKAVSCHETQMAVYRRLERLPEQDHRSLWGVQEFYRVFSLVNGGRMCESDLFEGLR